MHFAVFSECQSETNNGTCSQIYFRKLRSEDKEPFLSHQNIQTYPGYAIYQQNAGINFTGEKNIPYHFRKTIHRSSIPTVVGVDEWMRQLPLSSSFPFVRGEVLPATSSPPHLIVFSTLLCLLSSPSPAFLTSLLTQSSHLSLGLPRLLLPCSRNSAALFGSLSSAILSMCPSDCSPLLHRYRVLSKVVSRMSSTHSRVQLLMLSIRIFLGLPRLLFPSAVPWDNSWICWRRVHTILTSLSSFLAGLVVEVLPCHRWPATHTHYSCALHEKKYSLKEN